MNETGKSAFEVEAAIDAIIRKDLDRQRERARLERGVIEAAKVWRRDFYFIGQHVNVDSMAACGDLDAAVDALLDFESKQK